MRGFLWGAAIVQPVFAVRAARPRADEGQWGLVLLLMLGLVGLIWLFVFVCGVLTRRAERRPVRQQVLLEELCAAHRLEPDDVALLNAAAQRTAARDPLLLFLDPRLLERLATPPQARAADFERLGRRLFGPLFEPAPSQPRP